MGNAARRLFLKDGSEVFTPRDIPHDADVYISMGENYKDPLRNAKKSTVIQKSMAWTVNGLVWSQTSKKRVTKPQLTKRFRFVRFQCFEYFFYYLLFIINLLGVCIFVMIGKI